MSDDLPQIKILFTEDFKSRLRTLAKRYRSIRSDLQPLLEEIQSGHCPGDRLANIGSTVFKVRLRNSDIDKGKSGGYRVIYELRDNTCVLLIVIYSKSDQSDIPAKQIRDMIVAFDEQRS
jgi:mRNA-degrading endonuclease RelE of RelBE toxin-antitoxin system